MKLLICEGASEIAFICAYLKEAGYELAKENNKLYQLEGRNQVLDKNKVIKNSELYIYSMKGREIKDRIDELFKVEDEKIKLITDIGIFMDAEQDYGETTEIIKIVEERIKKDYPNINVHKYISPYNNGKVGMLEDLVMDIAINQEVIDYIKNSIFIDLNNFVKKYDSEIKNHSKAQFLIFAASKNPPKGQLHFFLTDEKTLKTLNFKSEKLKSFQEFIKNFIK